ncbi:unnamed protein product [Adineta steineri]|uniref:Uncharacterized protein n=1 Tax=Adineta steineri TaxID=433720 RepID=A0A813N7S1_9BILA|nr:unnamed protein product [Adineta steineri]
MKSLNDCVQEFIDQHSSTLFPTDSTIDIHRPRLNRFSSSHIDIEDEDPNLFVITPPIEYFLHVSSRLCREQFFKLIRPGHLLICNVLTASSRDMLVRILCFDDGHRRALHDLKLTATCLLNTSSNKNYNHHKKNRYDRGKEEISDEDNDDGEYQSGDFIRACVNHIDLTKEEFQLTIDPSTNRMLKINLFFVFNSIVSLEWSQSTKKLGLINEDDLPTHYILLRRQEEQSQSYEDILQTSKALNNRACVQTLYQQLKKRFEHFPSENNNNNGTRSSNDILHMTLINSFKRKQISSDEYFDKLRHKQDHEWAIESVAAGVRLMKENDSSSAVLHFNKALATDPKCVDAFVARGALSANQGHYKRAMQDFEEALKIDHKHSNASKYLHDVLNNIANDTDDYDDAIHYLEKALKYKPDDNETKRKLDMLRTKKKEATRKLEYGPSIPSNLQSNFKERRSARSPKRRRSSLKGISSSSSSSSRTSSSSSSSSTSTTSNSLTTISSSSSTSRTNEKKKSKSIPVIDITENDVSTTTQKNSMPVSSQENNSKGKQSIINENNKNGNSLVRESIVSTMDRSHSNDHSSKTNQSFLQRKTLPSIVASSSISQEQQHRVSSSAKKNTSLVIDREAEDIEKLYMQLKAKQSMEKRRK